MHRPTIVALPGSTPGLRQSKTTNPSKQTVPTSEAASMAAVGDADIGDPNTALLPATGNPHICTWGQDCGRVGPGIHAISDLWFEGAGVEKHSTIISSQVRRLLKESCGEPPT